MLKIVIASQNPVKLNAARSGFQRMFPEREFQFEGLSVPSGVASQPMTDTETLRGACQRAGKARLLSPEAEYWVGIEGGIQELGEELTASAWVYILSGEMSGRGRSAAFCLPPRLAELVRQGTELGEADDLVFNRSNSKQVNGAIGILSGDVIDRAGLYEQAVVMALLPFKNPQLYTQVPEYERDEFTITSDPARMDVDRIHAFLCDQSYWAAGIPRHIVEKSLQYSLCFGLFKGSELVGFARLVTDRATYSYICDVFIAEELRGQGLGKWLMETIMQHPELQGLRGWALRTRDAHGLYARFGFTPLHSPERWMEVRMLEPYPPP